MTGGSEERSELPEYSERTPVLVGAAIWLVLLVATLAFRSQLVHHGHGWWFGVTVAGVAQGLFAYWFIHRRQARLRAAAPGGAAPQRPGHLTDRVQRTRQPEDQPPERPGEGRGPGRRG